MCLVLYNTYKTEDAYFLHHMNSRYTLSEFEERKILPK